MAAVLEVDFGENYNALICSVDLNEKKKELKPEIETTVASRKKFLL